MTLFSEQFVIRIDGNAQRRNESAAGGTGQYFFNWVKLIVIVMLCALRGSLMPSLLLL